MPTSRIAFIGDRDSILGFSPLGVQAFPVSDAKEAEAVLRKATLEGYGIIFITERLASGILDLIDELSVGRALPAIVMVPGIGGGAGVGLAKVRRMVEKAVGVDILSR
jgi:V/A-type H+-transporting ATPase subunit F